MGHALVLVGSVAPESVVPVLQVTLLVLPVLLGLAVLAASVQSLIFLRGLVLFLGVPLGFRSPALLWSAGTGPWGLVAFWGWHPAVWALGVLGARTAWGH